MSAPIALTKFIMQNIGIIFLSLLIILISVVLTPSKDKHSFLFQLIILVTSKLFDGKAYAGFGTYSTGNPNFREVIGGLLSSPLNQGTKYYTGMKVCSSESSQFASNKLGISFSTVLYERDTAPVPINNHAMVYLNSVVSDTLNWTTISGSFIADSTYEYIMLGDFFSTSNNDLQNVNPNAIFAETYYYVDAVYVSTDSLCCFSEIPNIQTKQLLIFPNLVSDFLNINTYSEKAVVTVYDMFGKEQFKSIEEGGVININISFLSEGMYILLLQTRNEFNYQKFFKDK